MSALLSPLRAETARPAWRLALTAALVGLAALLSGVSHAAPPVLTPAEVLHAPQQFIVVAIQNPVSGRPGAVGGTAHGYGSDLSYRVSASAASVMREVTRQYALTPVSEWPIEALKMYCVLLRIPPGTTREDLIEKLRDDPRLLIVQPLNEFESSTSPPSDDPYGHLQANVRAMGVAAAHRHSRGAGVRVAIIDTGIDTDHPDLAGRTQLTRNYVDDDAGQFRADRHGTQVAGLIAAAANNGIGIIGVAPEVELVALKACWQATPGVAARCNSFTIAQALADALAAKAQVINLSLVGPLDPLLAALIDRATAAGVVVVGAVSGNPRHGFPARVPKVMPVAEAEDLQVTEQDAARILRAPARDIVTLVPDGHYDFASGNSLATAQISGVAALLLARNPKLGVDRVRELLAQSTEKHFTTRGPFYSVNACTALAQVVRGVNCAH